MIAINIRNVPPHVHGALKRRAEANRRSLQKELLVILERAAEEAPAAKPPEPLELFRSTGPADLDWSRDAMYGEDGR